MFNQPKGLSVFFLTEMWERYGFNMIELLIILYFINVFHALDSFSYSLLGSITALAYINSVIGGYLADRFIGHRMAVLFGALLLTAFYIILSFAKDMHIVVWSLMLFTMGTGLLKPNISSMVGSLYQEDDKRRYTGFTIFYIGINLGGVLGSSAPSYVQSALGWHMTYLTTAVVMLIAFFTFLVGVYRFKIKDIQPIVQSEKNWLKTALIILVTMGFSYYIINHQRVALFAFFVVAVVSAGIVIFEAIKEKGIVRMRILAYLVLVCISIVFWALFFQIFFSMNLFVDRAVNHHVFGLTLTTATFGAVEPFGVIVLGVVLSWAWMKLQNSWWNPSTPMKFSLGLWMLALTFGVLCIGALKTQADGLVVPHLIIFVYLILALAELLLSPTGLAMVTELVPKHLVGTMMGIFFISLGLGGKLAGIFANISAIPQSMTNVSQIEQVYHHAFFIYFLVCVGTACISLALVPFLKKLIAQK